LALAIGSGTPAAPRASPTRKVPPSRATLNQTACQIREVAYVLPVAPCDRCRQPARRVGAADRVAIDLDLDCPTLLLVTVGVHAAAAAGAAAPAPRATHSTSASNSSSLALRSMRLPYGCQ
jgi:hypothetical protein